MKLFATIVDRVARDFGPADCNHPLFPEPPSAYRIPVVMPPKLNPLMQAPSPIHGANWFVLTIPNAV